MFFVRTSMIRQISRIWDDVDWFLQKQIRFLLGFWLDTLKMQGIINFINHHSKRYASVVLSDSEVAFLVEGGDVTLYPFLYCVLLIYSVAWSEKYVFKFSFLQYSRRYFVEACCFSVFDLEHRIWESIEEGKIANCRSRWRPLHHWYWWDCSKRPLLYKGCHEMKHTSISVGFSQGYFAILRQRDWVAYLHLLWLYWLVLAVFFLFNGISTLFRLFNAKAILLEEQ